MLEQVLKYGVVSYDVAARLADVFGRQMKELQTVFYWGAIQEETKEVIANLLNIQADGVCLVLKIERKYIVLLEDQTFTLRFGDYSTLIPAPMVHELIPHLPPLIVTENGIPKGLTLDHASGPISDTSPRLMYGKTLSSSVLDVETTENCLADAYATMLCNLIERFPFGTLREVKHATTDLAEAQQERTLDDFNDAKLPF